MRAHPLLEPQIVFRPRLMSGKAANSPERTGYLLIGSAVNPLRIGRADLPEFRLVQSLFNPENSVGAKFRPTMQTMERAYANMRGLSLGSKADVTARIHASMGKAVKRVIRNVKRSDAGRHFEFHHDRDRVVMEIQEDLG